MFLIQLSLMRRSASYSQLIVPLVYGVLVLGVWGIFAYDRGLTFEMVFVERCQQSLQNCLMLPSDPLRPYNSLYLGLGYLLNFGGGGFWSYQLLYGLLWWGRGMLVYLIVQRCLPAYPLFAFWVGALAIVHTSDRGLNFLGQIHQLGFIFFLLLALYWLLRSWQASRPRFRAGWLGLALIALYFSLWTYESHFLIILLVPLWLWLLRRRCDRRFWYTTAAWYALPLFYVGMQLYRYFGQRVSNYQTRVMRPSLEIAGLLSDWLCHIERSLAVWQWRDLLPTGVRPQPLMPFPQPMPVEQMAIAVAIICAVVFGVGSWLLWPQQRRVMPPRSILWACFLLGGLWLVASFPAYLLLRDNTDFFRTQTLSGVGAALVWVAGLALVLQLLPRARSGLVVLGCCLVVFAGVQAGVLLQEAHGYWWQMNRHLLAQLTHLVPEIRNNTFILLTGVPKQPDQDPFGDALWIEQPLRAIYTPRVTGYYLYEDGSHPISNGEGTHAWRFTASGLVWMHVGRRPEVDRVPYSQVIAFRYHPDGKLALLDQFPREVLPPGIEPSGYAPRDRILTAPVPDPILRNYAR